jgi:hypothetical protein
MSAVAAQLGSIKQALEEEAAAAAVAAAKGVGGMSGNLARGGSGALRDSVGGSTPGSHRTVTRAVSSTR